MDYTDTREYSISPAYPGFDVRDSRGYILAAAPTYRTAQHLIRDMVAWYSARPTGVDIYL